MKRRIINLSMLVLNLTYSPVKYSFLCQMLFSVCSALLSNFYEFIYYTN